MMDTDEKKEVTSELKMADVVICTGVGKSGKMADVIASLWQSVGIPAQFVHATDLCHGGLNAFMRGEIPHILVLFSHSGMTPEILHLIEYVNEKRLEADTWLVTSSEEAFDVDRTFVYRFETDGSVHGTIPFYSLIEQLTFGAEVASYLADDLPAEDLLAGHPGGALASAYKREIYDSE
jgi:arabinose-5-phosphate isomerase